MMRSLLRRPSVWLGLAAALLASGVVAWRARPPEVPTAVLRRSDLEQHLVASGRVWVPTRVQISAQVPGLVVAVGAVEGQRVKTGDLLLQIDDAEARASVAQFKATVDQAKARVDQLKRVGAIVANQSLREADTNLEQAETDLERTTKLAAGGAVASVELDNARRAVQRARAQRAAAEAQQIAAAPMGADSRVALTTLLQAEAQLDGAQARLTHSQMVARQSGVVLSRSVEPGDVVQPGPTLMTLAADSDAQLVFEADERNLADIKLGQRARAAADAFPQQPFGAEVSYLAPSIDPQRGTVEVRLRALEAPAFLKPDMTVSIDLTVAAKQQAWVVPSEAVHGATTPSPWVLAVEGGRVARRTVALGIRGDGATEIASGLAEGAEVILPTGRRLAPGESVRPVREER